MRRVPDGYGVAKLQPNSRRIQGKCRKCLGLSALQKLVSVALWGIGGSREEDSAGLTFKRS